MTTAPAPGLPPVLCYHRIGGALELGVTRVAQAVFERQMAALARAGWGTLSLDEFAARVADPASRRPYPELLLTFDDGYASLADNAYPVLADLGFTATTFLITQYVGRLNTWDVRYTRQRLPHLDWSAAEHWRGRGFDFASHSVSHARLTWLSDAAVTGELEQSRRALVARLGPGAGRAIAYPFGACDGRVERAAGAAGYELGFGGVRGNGAAGGGRGALRLGRLPVYSWDVGTVPWGLRTDGLGRLARAAAQIANRCAVGTSVMRKLRWGRAAVTADSPCPPPLPSRDIPYPRRSSSP